MYKNGHKFPYAWNKKDVRFAKDRGKVMSCFCCGGGSSFGYKLAGYDVIACNEIDPRVMKMYLKNHDVKYSFNCDIRELVANINMGGQEMREGLHNLDILDASFPCSTFSIAGDREKAWGREKVFREGQKAQRLDDLAFYSIALAKELQPKVVVFENVQGLLQGEAIEYVKEIYKRSPVLGLCDFIVGYECKEKGIKIVECDKAQADAIIVPHHFSHKVTKNSCISLLVLYKGKIRGAMQIGYGIRPHIKTEKDGVLDYRKVREFDRMWLSDDMPKYSESICISLLHHYLRATHKEIKYLISYADTSIGNTGTIYKAANYELIDTLKADFYLLPSGERVHPVTMWHRHKTRVWETLQELYPGIKRADGFQLKFLKRL